VYDPNTCPVISVSRYLKGYKGVKEGAVREVKEAGCSVETIWRLHRSKHDSWEIVDQTAEN